MNAKLDPQSRQVLTEVAARGGVTLSALLEALAEDMREHPPGADSWPRWDEIVAAARHHDVQARRRTRRRSG